MPFIASVRSSFGPQGRFRPTAKQSDSTGGTITTAGGYRIHTFTSVGSSTFTAGATGNYEVLIVAAGGAGGSRNSGRESGGTDGGGAGGGGGLLYGTAVNIEAGNRAVTVGAGQPTAGPGQIPGSDGGPSSLQLTSSVTATALGGGGGGCGPMNNPGRPGGSGGGGGGGGGTGPATGGSATQGPSGGITGYGFPGGAAAAIPNYTGGSGGGAGQAGQGIGGSSNTTRGGNGISVFGNFYSGGGNGGGGGSTVGDTNQPLGGGGAAGTPATFYGGGGGGEPGAPQASGPGTASFQGIVIVRYPVGS